MEFQNTSTDRKTENQKVEINRLKIDILGILEMRWPRLEDF